MIGRAVTTRELLLWLGVTVTLYIGQLIFLGFCLSTSNVKLIKPKGVFSISGTGIIIKGIENYTKLLTDFSKSLKSWYDVSIILVVWIITIVIQNLFKIYQYKSILKKYEPCSRFSLWLKKILYAKFKFDLSIFGVHYLNIFYRFICICNSQFFFLFL